MKSKITKEQQEEIKSLYNSGIKLNDLAKRFNVTQPTISYHINPETQRKSKENAKKWFKNLPREKRILLYAKRKEYLKIYMRTWKKKDGTKK
jgi:transcriptional antiterminator